MNDANPEATSAGAEPAGAEGFIDLSVTVNGQARTLRVDPDMPILWLLRDSLGLPGTKYGCGEGQCGACTVHVDGKVQRACCTPCRAVAGKSITTIEGLSENGEHPLQKAWVEHAVPQCGYCQVGQIMTAALLLKKHPRPSVAQIEQSMAGNLCRCGTYTRIVAAVQAAAGGQ
jgi:isoquinoline 1-oxidoreductase alpha subunit